MSRPLLAIVLLAAVLRFGLLAAAYPEAARVLREDSIGSYVPLSHTLLSHGRFAEKPDAAPDIFRTPGYPVFLAATIAVAGDSIWRSLVAQVLVSLGTIVLVYLLAREVVAERAAAAAALVAAIDPPSNTHAVVMLTETVFTFLFAFACLAVCRAVRARSASWAAAAGLAMGLSILVRPIALYVGPLLALFAAVACPPPAPRRLLLGALVLALSLAPPLAWMARNASIGAGFLLSSIEGANLLFYRAAPVLARARGIPWQQAMDELNAEVVRRVGNAPRYGVAAAAASKRLALEIVLAHPLGTAAMIAEGTVRFWAAPGNADLMLLLGVTELGHEARWPERGPPDARAAGWLLGVVAQLVHVAILAAALCGLVAWARPPRWPELAFTLGLLTAFTLLSAGPGAYARFRVPVVPLIALLVAAAYERRLSRAALFFAGGEGRL